MLGTMATVLSATVVNVALHDIMLEFGIRQGQVHWLATGFIAAMTTSMLASSWLLDHWGVRRTLATAMALFSLISVAGGFAVSPEQLIAARVGQGAMAGLMQPMGMYLVFRIFPQDRRGQAMGIYGMGVILAPALGPVLGGVLVDELDWRYVLFAPVPVTLLGVVMAWRFLPWPRLRPEPYRFDWPGLALLGLTIALALDTLNRLQQLSGQETRLLGQGLVMLVSLVLFIARERTARHPLVNLALLRLPSFRQANLGALALGLALFGSTYLIPLFVQTSLGFSATEAGLLMLPAGGGPGGDLSPGGASGGSPERAFPGGDRHSAVRPVGHPVRSVRPGAGVWLAGPLGSAGADRYWLHAAGSVHRGAESAATGTAGGRLQHHQFHASAGGCLWR